MDLNITLAKANDPVYEVSCNGEASFNEAANKKLWLAVQMMMHGIADEEGTEKTFLKIWGSSRNLTPSTDAAEVALIDKARKSDLPKYLRELVREVKSNVPDRGGRATAYKILIAAALHSQRSNEQLAEAFMVVREVFDFDAFFSTLIADATGEVLLSFPVKSRKLSEKDRLAILAFCFLALGIDDQKHVLELGACRTIMTTLGVTAVDKKQLAEFTGKDPQALVKILPESVHPAALLNVLRMVLADKHLHATEQKMVSALSNGMPEPQLSAILKLVAIESGRVYRFAS